MQLISYLVENDNDVKWGLVTRTVGMEKINTDEKYPTDRHLSSYVFSADQGRTLDEYQIVYITDGEGIFESASQSPVRITAGMAFMLFPGEWHNYYPTKDKGWSQMWIGFRGANIDDRVRNGFFKKENPVFNVGLHDDLIQLYMQAISVAEIQRTHYQIVLSGIVNHILGLIYSRDNDNRFKQEPQILDCINKARMLMVENIESDMNGQDIAVKLGISYSLLRKKFKDYVGLSPSAYFQDLRLRRAIELLRNTNMMVKEIAYQLNFESPDYFSTQFKKKTGKNPGDFRTKKVKK